MAREEGRVQSDALGVGLYDVGGGSICEAFRFDRAASADPANTGQSVISEALSQARRATTGHAISFRMIGSLG